MYKSTGITQIVDAFFIDGVGKHYTPLGNRLDASECEVFTFRPLTCSEASSCPL